MNSGEADFGIVYSGDTYLGRTGGLTNDTRKYEKVYVMAQSVWRTGSSDREGE